MRDHRRLRAFREADDLVLEIYRLTRHFPRSELFALTGQMRRSALSIASNIVEGSTRASDRDYAYFVQIALGSAKELAYQLTVVKRLGYLSAADSSSIDCAATHCEDVIRMLYGIQRRLTERLH